MRAFHCVMKLAPVHKRIFYYIHWIKRFLLREYVTGIIEKHINQQGRNEDTI